VSEYLNSKTGKNIGNILALNTTMQLILIGNYSEIKAAKLTAKHPHNPFRLAS
jgi:hypothetical protein